MSFDPKSFYTYSSFATLASATAIVTTVVTAVSGAFSWEYPGWFPLAVAVVVSFIGDLAVHKSSVFELKAYLVRLPVWALNGCLIYTMAVGSASLAVGNPRAEVARDVTATAGEVATSATRVAQGSSATPVKEAADSVSKSVEEFKECMSGSAKEDCTRVLTPEIAMHLDNAIVSDASTPETRRALTELKTNYLALREKAIARKTQKPASGLDRLALGLSSGGGND